MITALFYVLIVVVWGTTWIAITFQTGVVPVENSVFYRFFTAAVIMFVFLLLTKRLQPLKLADHFFCMLQGACLFCLNFYFFYIASTLDVESGLLSVIFSMATIFNVLNNLMWHKFKPSRNTVIGAIIGVLGITLLFYPDFVSMQSNESHSRLLGVAFAVTGTFLFSSGNMITVRHNKHKLAMSTTTAWGMLYGSIIMFVISLVRVGGFSFDFSPEYLWSFAFLVLLGSILAFAVYLSLIARIGANKTAYTTVLFPIVALTISAFVEGYTFTPIAIIGLVLALLGNVIVFYKAKPSSLEKVKGDTRLKTG
ncbi:DMT family transporter [Cocleimonas flava]|uniref:Drug/metabolite transporter (DMT)-like permease n=1 Tax=Cocleimonas flava TaxID=634765 RepID=A0A4R1F3E3_9GAMM|nr:DMT family transporter [Cocleimonas flava]TCJ88756.1 drug/metabolite transporter (DMT)-like permease [Cocleimonas flava]